MNARELYDWQQELLAQPRIWWVGQWVDGSLESTGNMYATREGAEMEAAYLRDRKHRRIEVRSDPIHSDDLSRRRWPIVEVQV